MFVVVVAAGLTTGAGLALVPTLITSVTGSLVTFVTESVDVTWSPTYFVVVVVVLTPSTPAVTTFFSPI